MSSKVSYYFLTNLAKAVIDLSFIVRIVFHVFIPFDIMDFLNVFKKVSFSVVVESAVLTGKFDIGVYPLLKG